MRRSRPSDPRGVLAFYALAMGAGVGAFSPLKKTFAPLPAAFDRLLGEVSMATPAGWMNATAGEEQARTMGLALSTSASRTTFLAAKTAAMVAHALIVSMAMFTGLLVGNVIGHMGIGIGLLPAATSQMTLVGLVFGAIVVTLGSADSGRHRTMTISAGIAGLSFVLAVFLPLSESLAWLAKLNFWYPYGANTALVNGIDWGSRPSWPPARSRSPRSVSPSSPPRPAQLTRTTPAKRNTLQ